MKKTLLFIVCLVLPFTIFGQGLIISEVADGTGSGGYPKFVEITNTTDAAIDLNGYKLNKFTNANTSATLGHEFTSSYSLPSKASIVITNIDNQTSGQLWSDFSLSEPSHVIYGATNVNGNGDDTYQLVNSSDTQVDIYGSIGTDGTGQVWEYLDSYAYRNSNIISPNISFNAAEWTIAAPNTLDGQSSDLSSFLTPGSHTFSDGSGDPIVTNPQFTPAGGIYTSLQNVTITCETDGASIYYTLDGSEPTDASTLYSSPIAVSSTTTIKAKGYKAGYNASGIVSATYTFPEEVANIAALRAKVGEGGTYKLTGEAIISFMQSSRNQKFVQDATGGITIDDASGVITSSYSQFDGITGLIGTLSVYNSLVQFIPAADPGAASSTGNSVTPTEVTIPTLTANWEQYESTLIKVVNLTFADADGSATFANSNNYNVTDGSLNDFVIRTGFKDIDLIGEVIPTMASITGVAQRYNSTLQMFPRSLADVSSTPTNIPTAKAQAKFGPNPFTNELRIESASDIKGARLFNAAGQVVKYVRATNGLIETADVPAGMYILQVEFVDGTSTTQKLIKK